MFRNLKNLIAQFRTNPDAVRLRGHAFRGGVWLGSGSMVAQVFRFARNIVLTRLLAPDAFGLMAIVLSISSIMDNFTEIGIKEAILQNPNGAEPRYVNSAWWLSFGRSLGLYAVAFFCAPWVGRFYANPELVPLTRTALLSVVFIGAMSARGFVALKNMDFKRWTAIQYGSNIGGTLLTIGLTFFLRSVWALAIGFVAEYALLCLFSFVLCPFLPRFSIDSAAAKDLLQFSKGIFGLSFLNLVFARTDVFVLGKLLPASQLGVYTIATYLAQVPAGFALALLGQILMPMYSKIQGENARINRILGLVTSAIAALLMPAFMFALLSGRALLSMLYGSRYSGAALPLALAVLVAFFNIANGQITTVLYSTGRPQLHRRCVAIMAVVMIAAIYPLAKNFGMAGAQVAALIAIAVGYVVQLRQVRNLTGFGLSSYGRSLGLALGIPSLILVAAVVGRHGAPAWNTATTIAYGLVLSGIALAASVAVMARGNRAAFGAAAH